ncbi:MAG: CGNR zinc finger domain-containing protein, partial [Gemmatimonadetes bacterium]|nr:CGNR zinc finger domain-containing protein [Gemmatimonadota bacterium]
LLPDYETLLEWSRLAGILKNSGAKDLRREAMRRPNKAAKTLKRGRDLREAVFGIFSAVASGASPQPALLGILNKHLEKGFRHPRVNSEGSTFHLRWEDEPSLDRVLWPIVRSAVQLLTSDRLERVKVCSAADCDWLFVDSSRNRSRRWCDMAVCGNRSKVRRFRQNLQGS